MPSTISAGTTAGTAIAIAGDTTGALALQTNGTTTAMTIDTSQNVGIGTSSPSGLGGKILMVEAASNYPEIILNRTGTGANKWGSVVGNDGSYLVRDYTAGVNQVIVQSGGVFQFNSGYGSVATAYGCRAWVTFNGTGTPAIRASGNVSSIVDYGTGDYGVLFSTSMPDGNYSLVGAAVKTGGGPSGTNSAVVTMGESPSTAGTGVGVLTVDGTAVDRAYVYAAFFR